jgi:hypothetical protein
MWTISFTAADRVLRYRPDKRPDEADTIATVRALHAGASGRLR